MERSTFVYLDPKVPHNMAQCATCKMFLAKHGICSLLGKNVTIKPTMSCNMWSCCGPAEESEMEHVSASFTPSEVGLVDHKVRCEHCEYFEDGDNDCLLFRTLGIKNYKVNPHGCCNAHEPKDEPKSNPLKKFTNGK